MDIPCPSCKALHWIDERSYSSSKANTKFESCCKKGDVVLETLPDPPDTLKRLLSMEEVTSKDFRKNIREYNSALSFTSLKYSPDRRASVLGAGIQCFQIHGELYHLQGPLNPLPNHQPQFAQLFLYDPHFAAQMRQRGHSNLRAETLLALTNMLHDVNPFISLYKMANERLAEQDNLNPGQEARIILNPQLRLVLEVGSDHRRQNLPTANEVAMILPAEYGDRGFRDIVLAKRTNGGEGFSMINANHAGYMPLHYVLLFPHGELGWHWGLELQNSDGR